MATNKRKVMLPHTMGKQGMDLIKAREDIETVIYPAGIAQADLLPQLADIAGIALSGTPYKQTEMNASPAMQVVARIGVGYDAVEVPALALPAGLARLLSTNTLTDPVYACILGGRGGFRALTCGAGLASMCGRKRAISFLPGPVMRWH